MTRKCLVCNSSLQDLYKKNSYRRCSFCGSFCIDLPPKREKITNRLNRWAEKIIIEKSVNRPPAKIVYERVNTLTHLKYTGKTLLDVGCGKDDFLMVAKSSGFHVSGMDIAEPIIGQLIRHKIPSHRSLAEIGDRSFDIVTCFDVIEHTTDPNTLLEEIRRVTKKNGILYLSTPNAYSISARLLGESWWVFGPEGHYVLFTPMGIRILLKRYGYTILHLETNTITKWIRTRFRLFNMIGNKIIYILLFPFLPFLYRRLMGDNLEIIARKSGSQEINIASPKL